MTTRGDSLLQVRDLAISFRTSRGLLRVVDGVSFDLAAGECLAVVGESGSGKTVSALALISLLSRRQSVIEGSVKFKGQELIGLSEDALRADFALVKAWKADREGNLVYRKTSRNFNPVVAMCGKVTVAELGGDAREVTVGGDGVMQR